MTLKPVSNPGPFVECVMCLGEAQIMAERRRFRRLLSTISEVDLDELRRIAARYHLTMTDAAEFLPGRP